MKALLVIAGKGVVPAQNLQIHFYGRQGVANLMGQRGRNLADISHTLGLAATSFSSRSAYSVRQVSCIF
jgi:hypothetical protein